MFKNFTTPSEHTHPQTYTHAMGRFICQAQFYVCGTSKDRKKSISNPFLLGLELREIWSLGASVAEDILRKSLPPLSRYTPQLWEKFPMNSHARFIAADGGETIDLILTQLKTFMCGRN